MIYMYIIFLNCNVGKSMNTQKTEESTYWEKWYFDITVKKNTVSFNTNYANFICKIYPYDLFPILSERITINLFILSQRWQYDISWSTIIRSI